MILASSVFPGALVVSTAGLLKETIDEMTSLGGCTFRAQLVVNNEIKCFNN